MSPKFSGVWPLHMQEANQSINQSMSHALSLNDSLIDQLTHTLTLPSVHHRDHKTLNRSPQQPFTLWHPYSARYISPSLPYPSTPFNDIIRRFQILNHLKYCLHAWCKQRILAKSLNYQDLENLQMHIIEFLLNS